jgi:NAD(P)-dependent dehydrogenase (short-subunit alcohol dehydrogenase family)
MTTTTNNASQVKKSPQRVWITGGGSGIGRALALHYARRGWLVIVSGRTQQVLTDTQILAKDLPGSIVPMLYDVTDDSATESCRAALAAVTDHLDLVIMNAGTCEYIKGQHFNVALFRRVMDTNLFGMINTFNAAQPLLRLAPNRPHVTGVCSLAAFVGFPRAEAYGASKAASRYFLHSLRTDIKDLADVSVINPGFITTPMTASNDFPMPFLMDADTAAQRIARALERRPLEYNFPKRLVASLRLIQLFQGIWYRAISRTRAR